MWSIFQKFSSCLEQNTLVLSCIVDITASLRLSLCRLWLFSCAYYPEIKDNISFIFHAILCVRNIVGCFFILLSPPPYFSRTVYTVYVRILNIHGNLSLLTKPFSVENSNRWMQNFPISLASCVSLVKMKQGISSEGDQLGRVRRLESADFMVTWGKLLM